MDPTEGSIDPDVYAYGSSWLPRADGLTSKAASNGAKHDVSFPEAMTVFLDEPLCRYRTPSSASRVSDA